jgi:hypothetical protein
MRTIKKTGDKLLTRTSLVFHPLVSLVCSLGYRRQTMSESLEDALKGVKNFTCLEKWLIKHISYLAEREEVNQDKKLALFFEDQFDAWFDILLSLVKANRPDSEIIREKIKARIFFSHMKSAGEKGMLEQGDKVAVAIIKKRPPSNATLH